jgi:hypothetical protein
LDQRYEAAPLEALCLWAHEERAGQRQRPQVLVVQLRGSAGARSALQPPESLHGAAMQIDTEAFGDLEREGGPRELLGGAHELDNLGRNLERATPAALVVEQPVPAKNSIW